MVDSAVHTDAVLLYDGGVDSAKVSGNSGAMPRLWNVENSLNQRGPVRSNKS